METGKKTTLIIFAVVIILAVILLAINLADKAEAPGVEVEDTENNVGLGATTTEVVDTEEDDEETVPTSPSKRSVKYNLLASSEKDKLEILDEAVNLEDIGPDALLGYNREIGVNMMIPGKLEVSIVDDGSLYEVGGYRFEDGLMGFYNDVIVVFSCFDKDISGIPYAQEARGGERLTYRGANGSYDLQYTNKAFLLTDLETVYDPELDTSISGCGMVMTGLQFTPIQEIFLNKLSYFETREKYMEDLVSLYKERY